MMEMSVAPAPTALPEIHAATGMYKGKFHCRRKHGQPVRASCAHHVLVFTAVSLKYDWPEQFIQLHGVPHMKQARRVA